MLVIYFALPMEILTKNKISKLRKQKTQFQISNHNKYQTYRCWSNILPYPWRFLQRMKYQNLGSKRCNFKSQTIRNIKIVVGILLDIDIKEQLRKYVGVYTIPRFFR